MKRKIYIFLFVFITIICLFTSSISAIYLPEEDGKPLYALWFADGRSYNIIGFTEDNINQIPTNSQNGLLTFLGLSDAPYDGEYHYNLYDGSVLSVIIDTNTDRSIKLLLFSVNKTNSVTITVEDPINFGEDFMIYYNNLGVMSYCTYNLTTGIVTDRYSSVTSYWTGNLFHYGYNPFEILTDVDQNAYDRGFDDGYSQGQRDGTLGNYDQELIYQNGYDDGKSDGYTLGFKDGSEADNQAVYDAGVIAGQEQAGMFPRVMTGLFDALTLFFTPFLSIGVGGLTLYSLLGILVVVFIVMIIVKITRG